MSTAVASIAENTGGSTYAYRCSKSGLNQCMKSMSVDLKDKGKDWWLEWKCISTQGSSGIRQWT